MISLGFLNELQIQIFQNTSFCGSDKIHMGYYLVNCEEMLRILLHVYKTPVLIYLPANFMPKCLNHINEYFFYFLRGVCSLKNLS